MWPMNEERNNRVPLQSNVWIKGRLDYSEHWIRIADTEGVPPPCRFSPGCASCDAGRLLFVQLQSHGCHLPPSHLRTEREERTV